MSWSVAGLERHQAYRVSQIDGKPAYGGTPSDSVVVDAIRELKRRGFKVTLIPFILMDCAGYPWRGRITAATDGTSAVHAAVASFVGGTNDWGFRRFLRHCASLCAQAGGVDAFVLGSELRGLTWLNDGAGSYPFVQALRTLAGEVRAIVGPSTKIGYGADWSEYRGHQTPDGFVFHLDPLWADANSDFVGIDWYAPLTDWREGAHLDSAYGSIRNPQYLSDRMRGGEGFDWYYASDSDRDAQVRTPIIDTAHGEHWIFRPKDVLSWWSNAHHNRPGGVRSSAPTGWVPKSKPIRFIEYGCGAVDKGPNAPNLFQDPKSVESLMPPYSTGARDDAVQAAYLKAFADFYAQPVNNPVSPVYGGRMVAGMDVWCWDARPFPYFPQRADVWGDTGNWRTGHWLNGRAGSGDVRNVVTGILSLAGLAGEDLSLDEISGGIDGYVIERPMRVAEALSPVLDVLGVEVAEQGGGLRLIAAGRGIDGVLSELPREDEAPVMLRRDLIDVPGSLMLRCYDPDRDYQTMSVEVRHDGVNGAVSGSGRVEIDLPVVMRVAQARDVAGRMLSRLQSVRHVVTVEAEPLALLRYETGDTVAFDGGEYRVSVIDRDAKPAFTLIPAPGAVMWSESLPDGGGEGLSPVVATYVNLLDLPPFGLDGNERPVVVAACDPAGAVEVFAGAGTGDLTLRGTVSAAAGIGQLLCDLPATGGDRVIEAACVDARLEGLMPQASDAAGLRAGANVLAVLALNDEWELIQFREVEMLGAGEWRLSGLVRGQWGTGPARRAGAVEGTLCVLLPPEPVRAVMALEERGLSRLWRAGPAGFGGATERAVEVTAAWQGVSLRPRAPVHGRARAVDGGLSLSWIRCARFGGDGWEGEPPLGETGERYRLRFCQGEAVRRVVEVGTAAFVYTQAGVDFPAGLDAGSVVRIAQGSEVYGWGVEAVVVLG